MRRIEGRKRRGVTGAVMPLLLCLSGFSLVLSGCGMGNGVGGNGGTSLGYQEIVADMASIILPMDQESLAYDQILTVIGAYIEDPQDMGAEETRALVRDSIADFQSAAQEAAPYAMEEEFARLLIEWGIDPEEYQMNADARESYLGRYIARLQTMDAFLEMETWYEDAGVNPDFAYLYQYNLLEQESIRGYEYYSANYWFADWEEEAAAYAKEQIADQLQSFVTKDSLWESSRQAVEQKMTVYLEQLEDQTEEMAAYIGQAQEKLYQLEQELNELQEGGVE